ncbi:WD repeat-containing protein 44-like [Vigna radiata var. radiata]|uniref:WD repeat-containing protein 44-like n=1 Tax=Vigna radiata var. radiata TaxID=3916 RepID=A0A3Q0FIC0_VIGRR|nr:WD repeat-containing protein 44-like [Vigna radiata var. radiata]
MGRRKTMTMDWDGLGDVDDDDAFFESYSRLSTAAPLDLASDDDDDDDDFDDPRLSFASAISSAPSRRNSLSPTMDAAPDYGVWMAAPLSIDERRKRLLRGMGLDSEKSTLPSISANPVTDTPIVSTTPVTDSTTPVTDSTTPVSETTTAVAVSTEKMFSDNSSHQLVLVRSRSEGDIELFSLERSRREHFIGKCSKQRLTRTATEVFVHRAPPGTRNRAVLRDSDEAAQSKPKSAKNEDLGVRAFFLIKNLDTGKEFIVNEFTENGAWNRLSDLQTGRQLTMDEFEKTVGKSRVVSELMRRSTRSENLSRKLTSSSYISRSLRMSKRRGVAFLKNIKGVASGFIGEREGFGNAAAATAAAEKSQWVRVRQSGKSHKEVSALHLCQELQGHEGSIWTIRFSLDGRFLASAGEDKVIHVWEVQECEVMSLRFDEGSFTPIHPSLLASNDGSPFSPAAAAADKKKKGKFGTKKGPAIPDYVHVPETVFSLSDKPFCSFQGHLDDVLDLSWSRSKLLLSSSMDKTVRLWNLETRSCLYRFPHSDYVTCIQFNPLKDDVFISGSLDARVRIWSIPERHVVDWIDLNEMVTALSFTPDGQGAIVGTHKGGCRTYSTKDCKLTQTGTIEISQKKSQLRKVTGFQFVPGKPSEILVTSADSRIRILEGSEVVQKYKGFRNANSQIAASFSPDGRYIISASEDSEVYVWKHEDHRSAGSGKFKSMLVTRAHEHFTCKDVSVAIPWNCTVKGEPPLLPVPVKKHSKRSLVGSNGGEETPSPSSANGSKKTLPPLPRKSNSLNSEGASNSPREELGTDSGFSASFRTASSSSSSSRYSDALSSSGSFSSSFSLLDSGHISSTVVPTAWGLVIVTAGLGGEIRCYQNFGLPRRIRQSHLFGSYNSFTNT